MLDVARTLALILAVAVGSGMPQKGEVRTAAPPVVVSADVPVSRADSGAMSMVATAPERMQHARELIAAREAAAAQAAQAAQAAAETQRAAAAGPPAAPTASKAQVLQMINEVFGPLGSPALSWAQRVALCESGYNPSSYNAGSGASGVFQFLPSTWANTPQHASSVFDARPNVEAAAWLYQHDHGSAWSCH